MNNYIPRQLGRIKNIALAGIVALTLGISGCAAKDNCRETDLDNDGSIDRMVCVYDRDQDKKFDGVCETAYFDSGAEITRCEYYDADYGIQVLVTVKDPNGATTTAWDYDGDGNLDIIM